MIQPLKIAIIGYGKLGKRIVDAVDQAGYRKLIIDPKYDMGWPSRCPECIDVAICATTPDAGDEVVRRALGEGMDLVVGTTKFYLNPDGSENLELLAEYGELAKKNGKRVIYAGNFSTGVNIFWKHLRPIGKSMSENGYEPLIIEAHHTAKLDVSQTAKVIGNILLEYYTDKDGLFFGEENILHPPEYNNSLLNTTYEKRPQSPFENEIRERIDQCPKEKIPIISLRSGDIPGTHRVTFESKTDILNYDNIVKDRITFGKGAVRLAECIHDKDPGIYSVADTL